MSIGLGLGAEYHQRALLARGDVTLQVHLEEAVDFGDGGFDVFRLIVEVEVGAAIDDEKFLGLVGAGVRWNSLAAALFIDFGQLPRRDRNFVRLLFLDPEVRGRYADWQSIARTCVAFLRMAVAERPDDPRLVEVVGELSFHDADFRTWWAERDVSYQAFGTKSLQHPVAGAFTLDWQVLRSGYDGGQSILVMTAPPGTRSHQALRFLSAWTGQSSAKSVPM